MTSGFERQRPGQADALPLAAGELGGLLLLQAFGKADLLEAIGDKPGQLRFVAEIVLAGAERDVVEDRQAVEQRRHLEQEAEPEPGPAQLVLGERGEVAAVELDHTSRRAEQARSSA